MIIHRLLKQGPKALISAIRRHIAPAANILIFVLLLFILDGNACLFKVFTGIPCPGCGMSRSYLHLASFDISGAFHYHPLFILPILIAPIVLCKGNGHIRKICRNNTLWLMVLALVLSVWIIRMILLFPDNIPMDFNHSSVLSKLVQLLFG